MSVAEIRERASEIAGFAGQITAQAREESAKQLFDRVAQFLKNAADGNERCTISFIEIESAVRGIFLLRFYHDAQSAEQSLDMMLVIRSAPGGVFYEYGREHRSMPYSRERTSAGSESFRPDIYHLAYTLLHYSGEKPEGLEPCSV